MLSSNSKLFPTISLSCLSEYMSGNLPMESFHKDPKIIETAKELVDAFTEWGFVYLVDHGIPQDVIDCAYHSSKKYFTSEKSLKEKFMRQTDGENWGWVPFNTETFEKTRPFDLKECFNFAPTTCREKEIDDVMPEFMPTQTKLYNASIDLGNYVLRILDIALSMDNFLVEKHRSLGNLDKNVSISRLLFYPPLEAENNILENQLRCGEHSDYGTITFLFQDQAGGLQVVNPQGEYINATPIPGSIVMNGGDLLEIWSSGKFKSTRHRVVIPNSIPSTARQSLTFFVHPDSDVTVSCLDGSDKYPSVNALEYLIKKYDNTYG